MRRIEIRWNPSATRFFVPRHLQIEEARAEQTQAGGDEQEPGNRARAEPSTRGANP
jgi:hypothetical protein